MDNGEKNVLAWRIVYRPNQAANELRLLVAKAKRHPSKITVLPKDPSSFGFNHKPETSPKLLVDASFLTQRHIQKEWEQLIPRTAAEQGENIDIGSVCLATWILRAIRRFA
eukprot:1182653-Prorocentrum_minimum.AAC.2